MVVFPDKKYIEGSDVVLQELVPHLYPEEISSQVKELEKDLGTRLGSTLRCFSYHHLLQPENHGSLKEMVGKNTSAVEITFFNAMADKGITAGMRKVMKIKPEFAEVSKEELVNVFDELSGRLDANGPESYLCDVPGKASYGFTAADLTFAALAFHFVRPVEMDTILIDNSRTPAPIDELASKLKDTRAEKHALKMYTKHRPTVDGKVVIKHATVDRWPFSMFKK